MRQAAYMIVAVSSIAIAGLLAMLVYQNDGMRPPPQLTTPLQAVRLTNGQVFFGRLDELGSRFPILRDVYSVQTRTHPQTKEVTNVLVKRAQDGQGADGMRFNAIHILSIEPVQPGSDVDKMIQQAQKVVDDAAAR